MGKKSKLSKQISPRRNFPAAEVFDAKKGTSAVRVAPRRSAGGSGSDSDDNGAACRAGDRCSAGMNEPVVRTLDKLATLRSKAQRKVDDEDENARIESSSRLSALKALAQAGGRRSGVREQSPHRSHGSSGGGRASGYRPSGNAFVGTTLRNALGLPADAPRLGPGTALVLIDCQITYTEGPMKLHKVEPAIQECRRLLQAARKAGATVVHIAHHAGAGTLYDVEGRSGAIIEDVAPEHGEKVIVKSVPSSFHGTDLEQYLDSRSVKNIVICGFMTHCCVSSTARSAFNLEKYAKVAVVASATATRILPDARENGEIVDPEAMQQATLLGIAELHAAIVPTAADVPV